MSLRIRLFLSFGSLLLLLVAAQWWWVRSLADDLSVEIDQVAFSVGRSVASILIEDIEGDSDVLVEHRHLGDCADEPCAPETVVIQKILGGEQGAADAEIEVRKIVRKNHDVDIEAHSSILHLEHAGEGPFLRLSGRRLPIPRAGFQARIDEFSRRLLLGSLGFSLVGLLLFAFVAHRISAPLRSLSAAARQVGDGSFGARVETSGSGEVAQAVRAFNSMSHRLAELDALNRELTARRHLGEIGEIARGLAHSLRNPLNALGLSVEELATRAPSEPQVTELAESSRRQIRRIDRSIRSFLALASQSGGAVQEVDLGELVQDIALEALQDSPGSVRLEVDAEPGTCRLQAVEPELRAVVQALVVNAVEASARAGVVSVVLRRTEGGARLLVDDEGPGLPDTVRSRLFTPHLTTKPNGSGMGLFLAHRIATNRYSGALRLEDREPTGTRAVLDLESRVEEAGRT